MADAPENEGSCGGGCRRLEVPTEDELKALNAMRDIKTKARGLKEEIFRLASSTGSKNDEIARLENEVERLRKEWREWDEKRREAARIRMILLGHENPD
jgi:uncharacterized coiled-coil DUF342 family protein